jgi:hypothetical protein
MRNMGGLWRRIPLTAWTFLIGALALAGFPLTSGFFSKDEILTLTQHDGRNILYVVGLLTAFMTAFYTFRQFFMVFWGAPRTEAAEHARESPATMTIPLVVLAFFALLAGLSFGWPLENGLIHRWLEPVLEGLLHHAEGGIPVLTSLTLSAVVAVAGIGLAYLMYGSRTIDPASVAERARPLYLGSRNKWFIDEAYDLTFVRLYDWLAYWSARFFDKLLIDGAVNGVAAFLRGVGALLNRLQTGFVRSYALSIVLGLLVLVAILGVASPDAASTGQYLRSFAGPGLYGIVLAGAVVVIGVAIAIITQRRSPPSTPSSDATRAGSGTFVRASSQRNRNPQMRRIVGWIVSLGLAVPVTYIVYNLVDIPFFSAPFYSILGILFFAVVFALILDALLKLGIFDEHGWHLGIFDTTGPLIAREEPEEKHEPIVSRAERQKRQRPR